MSADKKERCVDLSIIILSWNTCALLEQCLRSLQCPQGDLNFEVVVVDNASEDDSRNMVQERFQNVRLVVNSYNVGFGAGNNSGIPATSGRYILFLNSDTVVLEGALARMVAYADAGPDIGILGPKLLNTDGSLQYSCRRFPNLATGFFRNTPLGRLFPNNRFAGDYLYKEWDHAAPRDVEWVSGAALMIRRALVDLIGAFDEEFYMYCEDVDLCWRANHRRLSDASIDKPIDKPRAVVSDSGLSGDSKGNSAPSAVATVTQPAEHLETAAENWRVVYLPEAVIYHHIGRSSDKVPTRMTYEFHRSQYLFYKKHYAATTPFFLRPIIPVGISLRAVGQLARYRFRHWKRLLFERPQRKAGGGS